ncbi:hypothetical protein L1987_45945 [Smallanthus sonchifolius]|uniref:Uncharacterized protein n=1 Tax=Smallanthus sonchifolius TaxID=185202 RepID=A0ACB9FY44_9ASTR|nr:hypothetical protein L1987_45945 [Smallanthus sonchifolius]
MLLRCVPDTEKSLPQHEAVVHPKTTIPYVTDRIQESLKGEEGSSNAQLDLDLTLRPSGPTAEEIERELSSFLSSFGNRGVPSSTRSYAKIVIGSRLFLTAMAIHLSLRVAPLDLQQGGNSRIPYVHVPAARMSILVYIATAINTFFFLLTKHPLFLRSFGTGTEMGAFSTLFTLVTGGFRGRPMWGTFWVWDARLTSVLISFLIYMGALRFQKLPIEPAPISIRAGPIDIPIIKSSVNWWNTSHQPGSISRYGTSIHVPMPIPILSNFANSPFSTRILFVLETRLLIPSFLESPLTEEIEAQEGIPKPSSLAESLCIHG